MPTKTKIPKRVRHPDAPLTIEETAEFLGVKEDTLRIWRRDRRGPKHTRVGGRVRYRIEDLQAYLRQNVQR